MIHKRLINFILAFLAIFFSATADLSTQSQKTAIRNARIVPVVGPIIEDGTVVISNGLIEAVGSSLPIPDGAKVIEGKGLTVYPGLIDSLTDIGLMPAPTTAPPRSSAPGSAAPGGPRGPEDRPGTTPWRNPAPEFKSDDPRIQLWRNSGFTSVLTTPKSGIFPGQGAVINLATTQDKDLVVKESAALMMTFERAPSLTDFPNSLMGVFGYIRQIFADANHYAITDRISRANPGGAVRPPEDRSLAIISESLQRNKPFLLPANQATEILRVLSLSDRLAIGNRVLYGGQGAYSVAGDLAAKKAAVLVSVKWPRDASDPDPELIGSMRTLTFRERAPTTPAMLSDARVRFAFYSDGLSTPTEVLRNIRESVDAGLPAEAALRALTLSPAEIFGVADKLGSIETGKIANLVVTDGDLFHDRTQVKITFVNGQAYEVSATQPRSSSAQTQSTSIRRSLRSQPEPPAPSPDSRPVFISNATILTITHGVIEKGSILIRNGRIAELGKQLRPPADAQIIDGTGQFVMPGIIDCHSHVAIEGPWFESGMNVSSLASIADVLNPDDINIYRTLTGGVTTANVLYSSFNPIGGQTVVIKNRWGSPAIQLLFDGAPPGIKFALGENPKRGTGLVSFGPPPRYPKTRMGVIAVIREAFVEARAYKKIWDDYNNRKKAGDDKLAPPRRDLKLEPLVEVMEGKRLVHVHVYRADDIVALLRVADEFGFKIATIQHALEAYKVAKEIAAKGAAVATFSDWWAFKFEAYDGIPYNAAMINAQGVVVSIKSDSAEEAHHLNHEAAKSMKWGGLSQTDALKLITLNPAKQLGIADRVGSIEVGKDADLTIWNEHPLSIFSVVQKVLIDGKVYFDRQQDRIRRMQVERDKKSLHDQRSIQGGSPEKK